MDRRVQRARAAACRRAGHGDDTDVGAPVRRQLWSPSRSRTSARRPRCALPVRASRPRRSARTAITFTVPLRTAQTGFGSAGPTPVAVVTQGRFVRAPSFTRYFSVLAFGDSLTWGVSNMFVGGVRVPVNVQRVLSAWREDRARGLAAVRSVRARQQCRLARRMGDAAAASTRARAPSREVHAARPARPTASTSSRLTRATTSRRTMSPCSSKASTI